MKELKPSVLIAIEVPEHAMGAVTYQSEYSDKYVLRWIDEIINIVDLPKGKWELIGSVTAEHIDFDPAEYIETTLGKTWAKDYTTGKFIDNASQGFRSLLTANDVHFVNPYADVQRGDVAGVEKWLEAESKLVEKILILKPL